MGAKSWRHMEGLQLHFFLSVVPWQIISHLRRTVFQFDVRYCIYRTYRTEPSGGNVKFTGS